MCFHPPASASGGTASSIRPSAPPVHVPVQVFLEEGDLDIRLLVFSEELPQVSDLVCPAASQRPVWSEGSFCIKFYRKNLIMVLQILLLKVRDPQWDVLMFDCSLAHFLY